MDALDAILAALPPGGRFSAQEIKDRFGGTYSDDEIELAAHSMDERNDVFVLRETEPGPYTFSSIFRPAAAS